MIDALLLALVTGIVVLALGVDVAAALARLRGAAASPHQGRAAGKEETAMISDTLSAAIRNIRRYTLRTFLLCMQVANLKLRNC